MSKPEPDLQAEFVTLTPEQERARKRRNLMLAVAILGFVVLVYFVAIARMKGGA